ncbi:MAG: alpha/beta hydrolase, partial [Gammaproteobacteria bacterium]|nr:alpha/beta hydrolase [Gammaproteobacteria bacterium]
AFLASRIQTAGGDVRVQEIRLPTQNGQWVAADLFRPVTATADNPAPLVVVVPGFQRSREALSNTAIELSRRGIVAISIDPYAQGRSSSSTSRRAATTEGYGSFALVDYAASSENLNYVDTSRIAITGHSAGGNAAIRAANYFGREAQRTGRPSKLHSVYMSGYVLTLRDDVLDDVQSNIGVAYALYDEGAYRNELGHGDLRSAPEALRVVNLGRSRDLTPEEEVEIGRYYGNPSDRSLRVVFNERNIHPFQPYMPEAMANQLDYFETVFGMDFELEHDDQVWYWKELLGAMMMIAALVALVPLSRLLLDTRFFRPVIHDLPPPQPRPLGRGRVIFWCVFAFSALLACVTYIPMAELSQVLFVDASSRRMTWFFPQRMNNAVMLWAVLNGTVGFLVFYLSYRLFGRQHGIRPELWGAAIGRHELLRAFLLAVALYLAYYLLLFAVYFVFHVDYNFLFMGVRVFRPAMLVLLVMYAPLLFIFFLSNSLRVNGAMRFEEQPEWRSMLLAGVANSLGLFLIVLVQYVTFALTGTVYWTDGWLYVNLLFAVVPMMFVLPYFNRYFFRVTGRIYLGPMVTCLIFVTVLISNTVFYLPL